MINPDKRLVTVFGGGGFIGRYVCERLFDGGVRVLTASRDPRQDFAIQPLAQVGQWGTIKADVTRPETVHQAVEGAWAVINLAGAMKGALEGIHIDGARNVADAARIAGAKALVHVSAIGADPDSEADYARTKGEGERAVREAFPGATIIRPSLVFGPEDDFTNRIAAMGKLPLLPVVAPKCRFQPVYVDDLARAIAKAALDPVRYGAMSFDIVGPQVLTMREFVREILDAAGRDPELVEAPHFVSSLISWFGFVPGMPLTRDQWLMLQRDNVAAEGAPGLEVFGIKPMPFAAIAPEWLVLYRRGGRFATHITRHAS